MTRAIRTVLSASCLKTQNPSITLTSTSGTCCDRRIVDPLLRCRDDVLEADCLCDKCKWFEKRRCEEVVCMHGAIPTVSEWGLVVMTLLLLTGAKIYFGRRRSAVLSS